jgi:hypothetical protein
VRYLTLLVTLFASTSLQAAIYKCIDADGVTQYRDAPCGQNITRYAPGVVPESAEDAAQRMDKTQRLLRAYDVENAERQRQETAAQTARVEAEKNCVTARDRLQNITRARALYRLDKDGDRVVLSFDERAASEQQARAAVEHWCE